MPYRLSRRAEEDLIQIYLTSAQAFGMAQAERYQDALEAAFERIAAFPEIARQRRELTPPVRVHPCRSHVVIYVVGEEGPFIIRVRHAHEDWETAPSGE